MQLSAPFLFVLIGCLTLFSSCGKYTTEAGKASYYGDGFNGKQTANGETFNENDLTAAHKTLPFNTTVKVKNTANGKTVTVRINDRGPFVKGRIIDLSEAAAKKIDMVNAGVVQVVIKYRKKKHA
jgi:rare lipoprotein A